MDDMDRAQREQEKMLDAIIDAARVSAVHVESAVECGECGAEIAAERQAAAPGCQLCVECQQYVETMKLRGLG